MEQEQGMAFEHEVAVEQEVGMVQNLIELPTHAETGSQVSGHSEGRRKATFKETEREEIVKKNMNTFAKEEYVEETILQEYNANPSETVEPQYQEVIVVNDLRKLCSIAASALSPCQVF